MNNELLDHNLKAQSCLVLFGNATEERGIQLITQHPIKLINGKPHLGQGREVTAETVNALRGIALTHLQWIPHNVLAFTEEACAFVVKGRIRPMAIPRIPEFDGVPLPQPNLLFIVRNERLWVYALGSDERPTPDSPVYRAPYPNMFHNNEMCRGNVVMPIAPNLDNLETYEDLFFLSNGTHEVSAGQHFSKKISNYTALLRLSQKKGTFDPAWLVPLGLSVKDVMGEE